ncbi:MAG: hypothetical protein AB1805_07605 [Nitrospirota bacterium]
MNSNKAVILAKVEGSYGVDANPTAAANAILCEKPTIEVMSKKLERNNVKPYFGNLAPVNIGEGLKLSFSTEIKGSGTVGTAPEIGVLFRGCNFTETITPGVKVDYDPNSNTSTGESLSMYYYLDGILHKILGSRGTFSYESKAGEYGKIKWDFTGIFAGPVDQAIVTGVYNQTVAPPRFVSAAFSIDSYAAIIETLKIDIANEIGKRPSANAATGILEYFIKNRKPTGEIDPEAVPLATKDFWTLWSNSSRVAMTSTLGAVAGNKLITTAPKVGLGDLKYGDREDVVTYGMPLVFTPNAGNDELKFSFQ